LRRKNAPNVSKKFEDVLKKSELGPAESDLGAPNWARRSSHRSTDPGGEHFVIPVLPYGCNTTAALWYYLVWHRPEVQPGCPEQTKGPANLYKADGSG